MLQTYPSGRTHTRLPDNVCSDLTVPTDAPADLLRARRAWGIAKRLQRRAAGPAPEAAITPPQMDRLTRMPSHWPAGRPEATDATPPRRSEPTLHEVLARLAPSVTRATQRRRDQQAAQ